jgi:hypothetical protein
MFIIVQFSSLSSYLLSLISKYAFQHFVLKDWETKFHIPPEQSRIIVFIINASTKYKYDSTFSRKVIRLIQNSEYQEDR